MLYITIGIFLILITIVWRFASTRHSLPCPTWLHWMVEMDNPFTKTNRAAVIVALLDLQPGMSVLDIGCGPGRLTIPLAIKVGQRGKVTAVDIQAGMLDLARKKAEDLRLTNIKFINIDIGLEKLDHDKFDRAVLVTVLGEIPNQIIAIKEIFNALKSGGILSVTEVIFDPHFQTRSTVTKLANEAGFKVKAIFGNCIAYTMHLVKQ